MTKHTLTRKFPWLSLSLLSVAYVNFGWYVSNPRFPPICIWLVIGWILFLCWGFIRPLTSFDRLIIRWFQSDTVAFLSIFAFAGLVSAILFWLHIFFFILTILATESLARLDIQVSGYEESRAFWMLAIVSITGLGLGWAARFFTLHPQWISQFIAPFLGF